MEYPSNSNLSKREQQQDVPEDKVLNKVKLSGGVTKHKKSAAEKIAGIFIQDDIANVKNYIITDVIVPTIKETILNTISMFFYGETRSRGNVTQSRPTTSSRVTYQPYRSYFDDKYNTGAHRSVSTTGFEYDGLEFGSRGDAELFLREMEAALDRYHTLSVFDMYDMAQEVAPFTFKNYGWTSLQGARVIQVAGGRYTLDLPKALPMERQR